MGDLDLHAIEYGIAYMTLPGQIESGDSYVVLSLADGALVAVIDGMGHGNEAAEVASSAKAMLENSSSEDVITLIKMCHQRLGGTRGAVISVASIDFASGRLKWTGIGNIEGVLVHAKPSAGNSRRDFIPLHGGIVGYRIPHFRLAETFIEPGDTLVLATDGVSRAFIEELDVRGHVQQVADRIMQRYALHSDDALVLVMRLVSHEHTV